MDAVWLEVDQGPGSLRRTESWPGTNKVTVPGNSAGGGWYAWTDTQPVRCSPVLDENPTLHIRLPENQLSQRARGIETNKSACTLFNVHAGPSTCGTSAMHCCWIPDKSHTPTRLGGPLPESCLQRLHQRPQRPRCPGSLPSPPSSQSAPAHREPWPQPNGGRSSFRLRKFTRLQTELPSR